MNKVPVTAQICIFGAAFMIGLIATSACGSLLATIDMAERTRYLILSVLQAVLAFSLPSFIVATFGHKGMIGTLSLNKCPSLKAILGVIISFAIGYIMLNQIIFWNDSMKLPAGLSEFEQYIRGMEDMARSTAETLLAVNSIFGLLINVLVIGLITGFAEEIFFRAGLQRLLSKALTNYWAVWVSALIFSAVHFQFYGFVPRMLLGAFFGYLYVWTGSIWVSVFAHALNNSVVVVIDWMLNQGIISGNPEYIGVAEHGFPTYAMISAVLFIVFIGYGRKRFFNKTKRQLSK